MKVLLQSQRLPLPCYLLLPLYREVSSKRGIRRDTACGGTLGTWWKGGEGWKGGKERTDGRREATAINPGIPLARQEGQCLFS